MNSTPYSNRYKAMKNEEVTYTLPEGRVEELTDKIARNRELSAATNKRRRALAIKKKIEQQREEKRRQEILSKRRERQKEATEKFQRQNKQYKQKIQQDNITVEDALRAIRGSPQPTIRQPSPQPHHPSPSQHRQQSPSHNNRYDSNYNGSCYNNFGFSSRSEAQTIPASTNNKYAYLINRLNQTDYQQQQQGHNLLDLFNRSHNNLSNSRQLFEHQLHQQQLQHQQLLIEHQKQTLQQFNDALATEILNDNKIQGVDDDEENNEEVIDDNDSLSSKDSLNDDRPKITRHPEQDSDIATGNSHNNPQHDYDFGNNRNTVINDRVPIATPTNTGTRTAARTDSSIRTPAGTNTNSRTTAGTNTNSRTAAGTNINTRTAGNNTDSRTAAGNNTDSRTAAGTNTVSRTAAGTNTDSRTAAGTNTDSRTAAGTNTDSRTAAARVLQILNDDSLVKLRNEYTTNNNNSGSSGCGGPSGGSGTDKQQTLKGILKRSDIAAENGVDHNVPSIKGISLNHAIKKDKVRDSIDVNKKNLQLKQASRKKKVRQKKKSVRFVDLVYEDSDDDDDDDDESYEDIEEEIITEEPVETSIKPVETPPTQTRNTISLKSNYSKPVVNHVPAPPGYARPVSARVISSALNKPPQSKPRISSAPVTRRGGGNQDTVTRRGGYPDTKPPIAVRNAFVDINVDGNHGNRKTNRPPPHDLHKGQMDHYSQTYRDQIENGSGDTVTEVDHHGNAGGAMIRLDKTPTDAEINWLWNKVRTCLNRDSPINTTRSELQRPSSQQQQLRLLNSDRSGGGGGGGVVVHGRSLSNNRRNIKQSEITPKNGLSESMAAFLTAETLSNESMNEVDINKVMDQAQRKQQVYNRIKQQHPHRDPTTLSIEEQQLMMSLDRLNERLRLNGTAGGSQTAPVTHHNAAAAAAWRPQSGFRGHVPLSAAAGAGAVREESATAAAGQHYTNNTHHRSGINRPTYNKPHLKGW
ncbi:uncharacterized protein LOC141915098 [Tubulanus polymorphus]|uniref:uncharacterized protein LOC141915098 n=1 Tax=Tubulanus polymorphus TaxID=672921 RepID=UPI003DA25E71